MTEISIDIRHCMFNEFQLRNDANAAACHICAALREGVVAYRTCRDCLKRFCEGDTSLEVCPRSERSLQSDIERIKVLIEDNLSLIAICINIGKVNKLGRWLPHQLISDNIQQTITICNFLLSKHH